MINLTATNDSGVHPKLARRLKDARAYGALLDVTAPRFVRFLMQPRAITRNGWLVDPQMNLEQTQERTYILPVQGDRLGQRLRIDRVERKAHLHTYAEGAEQEITVDMESMVVLNNRFSNP